MLFLEKVVVVVFVLVMLGLGLLVVKDNLI